MDIKAFTDDRPDENASLITGDQYLFTSSSAEVSSGAYGVSVTDDTVAARSVEHETMEIGLKVAANFGALVPYLDLSYNAEDTTAAAYKSEAGTDGGALDLAASDGDNSYTIGGGMNFMIGNHLSGGVRFGNTNGRDDYEESYMFGNLSLSF